MHGVIFPFAGYSAPTGFLMCDGSAVSRTTYAALFAAITIQTTGTTTSGSNSVTSVGSTTNMAVGMPISGSGIPAGTTISAIGSGTLTLSQNATASASGVALVVAPHGVGDGSTTFNVPDTRGYFLRGLDNGAGVDSSRVLGTKQQDAMQGHHHSTGYNNAKNYTTGSTSGDYLGTAVTNTVDAIGAPTTDGSNGTPRTAAETRPKNLAVNHIIKT